MITTSHLALFGRTVTELVASVKFKRNVVYMHQMQMQRLKSIQGNESSVKKTRVYQQM